MSPSWLLKVPIVWQKANKAFTNNWFKTTNDLNLTKTDLGDLLSVATKGQLFQFNGALYEQTDGVAMGSPVDPLLANVFMSHIEENLEREGKLPSFYRRYVDHTLTIMPNIETASNFLDTLNKAHSSVKFTMETERNGMHPFLDIQLLNRSPQRETKMYGKTHQFRSTLTLSESCPQSLQTGLTKNYAWSSTTFIFILDTFFRRLWPFEISILMVEVSQTSC